MFATPLRQPTNASGARPAVSMDGQETPFQYEITDHGYGKDAVKVLHVSRKGPVHTIQEFEVGTHLKLYSKKDYYQGNNSDIVATDSQKNTVYLLAKKYGIESPEKFALMLGQHFLNKYSHVEEAHVHVETYPWQRVCQEETKSVNNQGQGSCNNFTSIDNRSLHNHAFIFTPTALHYCDVVIRRTDPKQTVITGIKGLRVLKTTQSSFVNFVNDEFRSLPDQYDRIFSTVVDCSWEYSDTETVNFSRAWQTVKNIILRNFAGDPQVGVSSPSVQHTLYLSEKQVLDVIPQVSVISMTMPNKHYFNFDTKPFQKIVPGDNNEVFIPVDKPHGTIYAQLARKNISSHL
ncbi:uricase [Drosophila miranda]|uniref:Uricase n=1 Tax=Drosophila pseudoobscura pseudoobscura TaxID=46245 RepID=URIC_DROPS|nr:uricase [Drosophila miranda]P22673.2 RecName: Full=Uricase; AltName: Full=Urate oxidase [Drosophila pseudoobscura pseudoobscura]